MSSVRGRGILGLEGGNVTVVVGVECQLVELLTALLLTGWEWRSLLHVTGASSEFHLIAASAKAAAPAALNSWPAPSSAPSRSGWFACLAACALQPAQLFPPPACHLCASITYYEFMTMR